ncbi:ABC transporter ATP-binding protein [Occultella aeris]|uniref:ABC transporter ATP-binding protein n=1 Tax=Occultella aeris TaxID=2761496 RepID=UPI0018D2D663|nr:ABC transporter ATP-binding protein [Occultella aeris]
MATTGQTWRALAALTRGRRGRGVLAIILLLGGSGSALFVPRLLGVGVDQVATGRPWTDLAGTAGLLFGVGVATAALGYLGGTVLVRVIQDVIADLREDVVAVVLDQPVSRAEAAGSSDVVSRVTRDVEAVTEAADGVLPAVVGAAFTILLSVAGIAVIDPRLALAAGLAVPFQWYGTRRFVRASRAVYTALRVAEAERGQAIIETVAGAETVRAHGVERERLAQVHERGLVAIDLGVTAARLRTRFFGWLNLAEFVGLTGIIVVGFQLVDHRVVTVGAATAAALYFHRLFAPIGELLTSLDDLQRAGVGLARLVGVAGLRPNTPSPVDPAGIEAPCPPPPHTERARTAPRHGEAFGAEPDGTVRLRDVQFSYGPGRRAVDGVGLQIADGELVALVGASGSGKSTLARLISGELIPDGGEVLVGGARAVDRRRSPIVALVTQEVHVFEASVADNLRLGAPDASEAQLWAALRAVHADFVSDLPDGLDTLLGAHGLDLDAGTAQHLALARVVLMDPRVVVLDEATAEGGGADPELLTRAMAAATAGRTGVVVAHRLSQARSADRVVVLRDGALAETGSHEELMAMRGEYARLWAAWSSARPGCPRARHPDDRAAGPRARPRVPG